ncbi:hypothetical protein AVEN_241895-1, partial [Araneus ventricosus]
MFQKIPLVKEEEEWIVFEPDSSKTDLDESNRRPCGLHAKIVEFRHISYEISKYVYGMPVRSYAR